MKGNNRKNNKYGYEQQQVQVNLQAHDRILVFENFRYLMEGLEEYIEKTGQFPNFKRQFRNITVPKGKNYSLANCESLFRTRLLLFVGIISDDTPDDTKKEVKDEFHKWINLVGIDVNNCPDEKLKHFLVETSNVMEGNGEKIVEQTKKYLDSKPKSNPTSLEDMKDVIDVFSSIQVPLEKKRGEADFYKDKNYFGVKVESKFDKGSSERGEQVYSQLAGSISNDDFSFYPQVSGGSTSLDNHPTNLNEVVQAVKANPKDYRLDEVAIEIDNSGRVKKKQEAVYYGHARLDDFNQEGKLNFNNNPIYPWESFNAQQRFEIKQAKNISSGYWTEEEIKWVVREFKDNPGLWEIKKIDRQFYLVHNSAQIQNNEIGTLIHSQQKFSREEWTEIDGALKKVNNIKQNASLEKGLWVVDKETGEVSENEDWFIHNQLEKKYDDKTGYLIYVPSAMIRVKDLSEGEQKAVGYVSEREVQQTQTSQSNRPQGGKGLLGNPYIWGSLSIVSLIGLAFTR